MRKLLLAGLVAVSAVTVDAQGTYKVPRTPDGHPDFQGYWTNLTYTPYERPKDLAGKAFYTEKEAIDAFNKAVADSQNQVVHYVSTDFGATPVQTGAQPNLRTSLVIDPADGRIPPMTPEAQKREAARAAAERAGGPLARTWRDDRGTVWCVFHDRVVPSVVAPYGSNYHIVQSKDFIVMVPVEQRAQDHPARWPSARHHSDLHRRFARPLGGRHARRRHHQLHTEANLSRLARDATGRGHDPGFPSDGALHAHR